MLLWNRSLFSNIFVCTALVSNSLFLPSGYISLFGAKETTSVLLNLCVSVCLRNEIVYIVCLPAKPESLIGMLVHHICHLRRGGGRGEGGGVI